MTHSGPWHDRGSGCFCFAIEVKMIILASLVCPRSLPVLTSLILPIMLSTIALFFASFVSWMVLELHKKDWTPLAKEDEVMTAIGSFNLPVGSYMFPFARTHADMKSEGFQKKYAAGPRGIITIMPKANMGAMLGLTVLYFFGCSFLLGYLANIAFKPGAEIMEVFRFVFTAAFMTFIAAMISHAIWFKARIVGHLIESLAYAAITATIFAAMWPKT